MKGTHIFLSVAIEVADIKTERYDMSYLCVGWENSGDIELYYEDMGEGRPVVLIHGWPLSAASWEKQVPVLLDAGYRVITYDRRGFGRSSQPSSGYTYDTFAEDLNKLMTSLDISDATLVGFSMGGGEVARYLAMFGSLRVSQAAFISAIPPFLLKTGDNPTGVDGEVFDGIRRDLVNDRPAFLTRFFRDFYNTDTLENGLISSEAIQLSWNTGAIASPIATLDSVTAWQTDFRNDLSTIKVPSLVVHGDSDRIVPFAASGKLTHEAIPGSRLEVIKGGPHGLNWTHAAQLNHALLEFLKMSVSKKKPASARGKGRRR